MRFRNSKSGTRLAGDDGAGKLYVIGVLLWVAAAAALLFTVVGLDWWYQDAPLNTFSPKGDNAQAIQPLALFVFAIAGVMLFAVPGAVLFISLKHRKSAEEWEDGEMPVQSHGNNKLEVFWTVTPALLLAAIGFWSVTVILELNDMSDVTMEVDVVGQQWWWEYEYDIDGDGKTDITTANELVIPIDEQIQMNVTSNDVIHSFWIPELNGKRDAVPNLTTPWKMQADAPGRYRGQCTEFCGLSHAKMQMYVIALPRDEFDAWAQNQMQDYDALTESDFASSADFEQYDAGRQYFAANCAGCHTIGGLAGPDGGVAGTVSGTAPNLTHLMTRETFAGSTTALYLGVQDTLDGDTPVDNYNTKEGLEPDLTNLEAWIRNPEDIKPMAPDDGRGMPDMGLTEEQIQEMVAFLTTLK